MKVEIKGYIVPNDDKEIYDYFGISATCPKDITDAIAGANEKGEILEVEITTCYGGDVFSGSEMYASVAAHKGEKIIRVLALAASAATELATAGPNEISPTAMIMVHRASSIARGNCHAMNHESEALQQVDRSIASAYMAKSGMSEEEALALMDKETWITAQQAVELKLFDRVMFEDDQMVAAFEGGMLPKAVIEKTRKMLREQSGTPTPPALEDDAEAYGLARAKLNLIEKTI